MVQCRRRNVSIDAIKFTFKKVCSKKKERKQTQKSKNKKDSNSTRAPCRRALKLQRLQSLETMFQFVLVREQYCGRRGFALLLCVVCCSLCAVARAPPARSLRADCASCLGAAARLADLGCQGSGGKQCHCYPAEPQGWRRHCLVRFAPPFGQCKDFLVFFFCVFLCVLRCVCVRVRAQRVLTGVRAARRALTFSTSSLAFSSRASSRSASSARAANSARSFRTNTAR